MIEEILTGKKWRVLKDKDQGLWERVSWWNTASDTECADGKSVEEHFSTIDNQFANVNTQMNELKKSVSDGKSKVATAITNKGVPTATTATFDTMATNIANITTGIIPKGTITISSPTSGTDCTNYATIVTSGLVKPTSTKVGGTYALSTSNQKIAAGTYFSQEATINGVTSGTLTLSNVTSGTDCTSYSSVKTSGLMATPTATLTLTDVASGKDCLNYAKVTTSGLMKTPTATLTKSYTSNGTETVDCTNYAKVSITRNITTPVVGSKYAQPSARTVTIPLSKGVIAVCNSSYPEDGTAGWYKDGTSMTGSAVVNARGDKSTYSNVTATSVNITIPDTAYCYVYYAGY